MRVLFSGLIKCMLVIVVLSFLVVCKVLGSRVLKFKIVIFLFLYVVFLCIKWFLLIFNVVKLFFSLMFMLLLCG